MRTRSVSPQHRTRRQAQLTLEPLESRTVPYAVTGNAWIHPELVTISFVPDGTIVGVGSGGPIGSNLFSVFDAKWSTEVWQAEILRAAQEYAQNSDLNFSVVEDDGASIGSGSYQQGDPDHGDIRIGGYVFSTSWLAVAYAPPPVNNYDIAGDYQFNTGKPFNIGWTYDLFTVAQHETGHSLGLGHSTNRFAAMFPYYMGAKPTLHADDIAGIQAIYGARSHDAYDAAASNDSFATATDVTSEIDSGDFTAVITGLDVTTTSDVDYYSFTAPSGSESSMTINVQSQGLSLLAPAVTVYASDQSTVLGSATGSGYQGSTLSVTISDVEADDVFYVVVDGANGTAFGTGAYALTLNLGTGDDPEVPLPDTQELNGDPIQGGGGSPFTTTRDEHDRAHGREIEAQSPAVRLASVATSQNVDVGRNVSVAMILANPSAAQALPAVPSTWLTAPNYAASSPVTVSVILTDVPTGQQHVQLIAVGMPATLAEGKETNPEEHVMPSEAREQDSFTPCAPADVHFQTIEDVLDLFFSESTRQEVSGELTVNGEDDAVEHQASLGGLLPFTLAAAALAMSPANSKRSMPTLTRSRVH